MTHSSSFDLLDREMLTYKVNSDHRVSIHVQAVHDLEQNEKVLYWECLTRVEDGGGDHVLPIGFFDSLSQDEREGIFRWQLNTSLDLIAIHANINSDISIGLNISAKDLASFGVAAISVVERDHDIHYLRHIVLEVLEFDCDAEDMRSIREAHLMFQDRGIRLTLDDFGSRSANYEFLETYSGLFDFIKVDGMFFRQSKQDIMYSDILQSVINTMKEKGKAVIIEHIESSADVMRVDMMEACYGQGYYLSLPSPLDTVLIPSRLE